MDYRVKNETGNVYTRLLVIGFDKCINNRAYWKCYCDPKFGGCGITTSVSGKDLRGGNTKSCGCYMRDVCSEVNKHPKSEETKKKISISKKGKFKGKDNPMYGKHHSKETRLKISKMLDGKNIGKDHWRWDSTLTVEEKQGDRKYHKYYKWRRMVFDIDNYTCQRCGDNKGGNLNAHHIEGYNSNPELRTEVSNGITLCKDCHLDFHHQYGYGDNTRAQLEEFLYYGK